MKTTEKTFDLGLTEVEVITLSECLENIVEEAQTTGNDISLMTEMAKCYTEKHVNQVPAVLNVLRTYSYLLEQIAAYSQHLNSIRQKAQTMADTF